MVRHFRDKAGFDSIREKDGKIKHTEKLAILQYYYNLNYIYIYALLQLLLQFILASIFPVQKTRYIPNLSKVFCSNFEKLCYNFFYFLFVGSVKTIITTYFGNPPLYFRCTRFILYTKAVHNFLIFSVSYSIVIFSV